MAPVPIDPTTALLVDVPGRLTTINSTTVVSEGVIGSDRVQLYFDRTALPAVALYQNIVRVDDTSGSLGANEVFGGSITQEPIFDRALADGWRVYFLASLGVNTGGQPILQGSGGVNQVLAYLDNGVDYYLSVVVEGTDVTAIVKTGSHDGVELGIGSITYVGPLRYLYLYSTGASLGTASVGMTVRDYTESQPADPAAYRHEILVTAKHIVSTEDYIQEITDGVTVVTTSYGLGDPIGTIAANPGSLYIDASAAMGGLYLKRTESDATGWSRLVDVKNTALWLTTQTYKVDVIAYAGTIALDASSGSGERQISLVGNVTSFTISGMGFGQYIAIEVIQGGGWTIAFSGIGGTAPVIDTAANSTSLVVIRQFTDGPKFV